MLATEINQWLGINCFFIMEHRAAHARISFRSSMYLELSVHGLFSMASVERFELSILFASTFENTVC